MSTFASPYKITIPQNMALTEFVTEHWTKFPEKVAIVDSASGRRIKYGQLLTQIGTVAQELKARGVKEGEVVGIHLPNTPEYISTFQAVASLGAVNTTSNPLYTPTELAHQFRDSKAKYAITIPQLVDTVKAAAAESGVKDIWVLGAESGKFLLANDGVTKPKSGPLDPATKVVVLPYSSGTTGLPKGTMLSHLNLISNVEQCIGHPEFNVGLKQEDVCLGLLPQYHIYGMTFCSMTCMRLGTTLVSLPKFDPLHFLETMVKEKVTFAPLVPPIINFLARHPAVAKADLSALRIIFSGAAPLDAETQKTLQDRFKHVKACQGYGMTELSPVSHIPHPGKIKYGSVGLTVPNAVSKIIDESGKSLPPGEKNVGELCVKGPNTMLGYLNNLEATKKTIIDGFVHTGDVAWRDEDGYVYIVDRLKELIKSKGFQVAPAELEGLLLQHPLIMDAAVVGRTDARAGEVPVAFVVKKTAPIGNAPGSQELTAVTEQEVKDWVADKVAEYKQLANVIFVDAIPKSAAGKILRRLLKDKAEAAGKAAAPAAPMA